MSRAFDVVASFERAVAEYTGAEYAVAVDSGTSAIFLSLVYDGVDGFPVWVPKRTYISVPMSVIRAGGTVKWSDNAWSGSYSLFPTRVIDSALRFRRGMHYGGLTCLSFHARKILNIGRGGMVVTNDSNAVEWLQRARFDGRTGKVPFMQDQVREMGWNAYMTPEQAARGLQLLEALPDHPPDLRPEYPDLSLLPVFSQPSSYLGATHL